jgi:carbon monoxide dehydrogenase subunit G
VTTVIEGQRRFDAPPERVFALLTDPDVVVPAIPAVRGHTVVDPDHWHAKVKPPLPLAPSITIRFAVLERRAPEHAALRAQGGGADVTSTFELAPSGDGTLMHWRTELTLSGVIARLVGPGLDAVAQRQATRTLDAVERALAG